MEKTRLPEGQGYRKPRILVAPLDWGLGHATRCIPVIHELLRQGTEVWLATDGAQQALLSKEFPELTVLKLKGYNIKYSRSASGLLWNILFQTPHILKTIKEENSWLKEKVKEYKFDAVIADNRFGLYHSSIPSIFITHQLKIKTPLGKWSESVLQKMNCRYINKFSECWVPDNEQENNLAGELSHPGKLPVKPIRYIGLLSRLKKSNVVEKKGHLFISLSGPEPQRTLLENIIINEVSHYNKTATIVRGLPNGNSIIPSTNDIKFYNHLPADEYNKEMAMAEYVISRSGYSTVMDIMMLGKKSILIPTPGQTEQEYIADHLLHERKAFCVFQKEFSLKNVLEKANEFEYKKENIVESKLTEIIDPFLKQLKEGINSSL